MISAAATFTQPPLPAAATRQAARARAARLRAPRARQVRATAAHEQGGAKKEPHVRMLQFHWRRRQRARCARCNHQAAEARRARKKCVPRMHTRNAAHVTCPASSVLHPPMLQLAARALRAQRPPSRWAMRGALVIVIANGTDAASPCLTYVLTRSRQHAQATHSLALASTYPPALCTPPRAHHACASRLRRAASTACRMQRCCCPQYCTLT
jgi:hypothetical protein